MKRKLKVCARCKAIHDRDNLYCREICVHLDLPFMTVERFIIKKIVKVIQTDDFELDNHLSDDLGYDSLERIELISEVEMEYGVKFSDGDVEHCDTPEKIIQIVESRIQ